MFHDNSLRHGPGRVASTASCSAQEGSVHSINWCAGTMTPSQFAAMRTWGVAGYTQAVGSKERAAEDDQVHEEVGAASQNRVH